MTGNGNRDRDTTTTVAVVAPFRDISPEMDFFDISADLLFEMADSEKDVSEIEKIRDHQSFVVELATKQNIIACLPTGSGKTLIAVELTKFYLHNAMKQGQKIIFLTNTVPLAKQQAEYFRTQLSNTISNTESHHVECLTGDRNVDVWNSETWCKVLSNCEVLVMTSQIFLDAIDHANEYLGFEKVILLVLDECHHANKSHPMNLIMGKYRERLASHGADNVPRVLGLTASIINGKNKLGGVGTEVEAAEKRLCCKAVTYHKYEEMLQYATNAKIEYITYNELDNGLLDTKWGHMSPGIVRCLFEQTEIIALTKTSLKRFENQKTGEINHSTLQNDSQLFGNQFSELKDLSSSLKDILDAYEDLGPYCARLAAIQKRAFLNTVLINDFDNESVRMLYYSVDPQLLYFMSKIDRLMYGVSEADQIQIFISEKLKKLLGILNYYANCDAAGASKQNSKNDSSDSGELCGIIFVKKRVTAQILNWYLQDAARAGLYSFVKSCCVVGNARCDLDPLETRITARIQANLLRCFRSKKYNLLVATNVVEEGLDVPACNLVVRFDKIESYPSYIQSMGRARSKNSKFYAILKKSEEEQQEGEYEKFREFNIELSDHLKHNATHADEDSSEMDIDVDELDAPIIPDFVPIPGGPRITANAAISIAYRYCQTLPCDKLTTLAPVSWWMQTENNSFQAFVQFPSNSVIRDVVEGKEYRSKGLAKRSAFLEACKRLHKEKALDDKLFPIARKATPVINSFLDTSQISESLISGKKVGSTKRYNRYRKKIPLDSEYNIIEPGVKSNVYELVVELLEAPSENDEIATTLYQFTKRQYAHCLITTADLSVIPQFILKINTTVGNMKVTLKSYEDGVVLSADQITKLQGFEQYLFGDILKLKNEILLPAKSSSFLFAPLLKTKTNESTMESSSRLSVHWELVQRLLEIPDTFFSTPLDDTRRNFKCDPKLYDDAVVIPWYRGVENYFFTVMYVMEGKTPLSPFEYNKSYKNYTEYFMRKYPLIKFVSDTEQPLLKVKEVSGNLNFFKTSAGYKKTQGERKDARGNIVELIPELTNLHPMPASLFIQSKFLPSILQRINRFLSARELQKFVAAGTPWEFMHSFNDVQEELNLSLDVESPLLSKSKSPNDNEGVKSNMEVAVVEVAQPLSKLSMENDIVPVQKQDPPQQQSKDEQNQHLVESIEDAYSRCILDYIHPNNITTSHIQQVKGLECERRQRSIDRARSIARNERIQDEVEFLEWEFTKETPIELIDSRVIDNILTTYERFDRCEFVLEEEEQPSLFTIMQTITTEGSLDSISLERLETIGDSFLKYCVSRHVFSHFPEYNEGEMTRCRSDFVSNAFLYSHGKKLHLGGYLAAGIFQPDSAWLPPSFTIPTLLAEVAAANDLNDDVYIGENIGDLMKLSWNDLDEFVDKKKNIVRGNTPKNVSYSYARISDKSIADSVEALIGAYFLAAGAGGALLFMEKLGLRGPCLNEAGSTEISSVVFGNWPNPAAIYVPGNDCVEKHLPYYKELELLISYKFQEPWLLVEAFSHAGYMRNRVTGCYQRLEFLGDSVLDFLVTNHIFKTFKKMKPGDLTDLRSALVNNVTFGSLAVRYGLHTYLRHTSKNLQDRIDDFVQRQREVGHKVVGHFKLLSDFDCRLVEDIEVPKVLGDIFESLAGAVFVDSGMSLDTVWRVFYRLMKHEIDEFSINVPKSPVRELHERFPGRELFKEWTEQQLDEMIPNRKPGLTYVTLNMPITGLDGSKPTPVTGTGKSKQAAKLGLAKYVNHLNFMNGKSSTSR